MKKIVMYVLLLAVLLIAACSAQPGQETIGQQLGLEAAPTGTPTPAPKPELVDDTITVTDVSEVEIDVLGNDNWYGGKLEGANITTDKCGTKRYGNTLTSILYTPNAHHEVRDCQMVYTVRGLDNELYTATVYITVDIPEEGNNSDNGSTDASAQTVRTRPADEIVPSNMPVGYTSYYWVDAKYIPDGMCNDTRKLGEEWVDGAAYTCLVDPAQNWIYVTWGSGLNHQGGGDSTAALEDLRSEPSPTPEGAQIAQRTETFPTTVEEARRYFNVSVDTPVVRQTFEGSLIGWAIGNDANTSANLNLSLHSADCLDVPTSRTSSLSGQYTVIGVSEDSDWTRVLFTGSGSVISHKATVYHTPCKRFDFHVGAAQPDEDGMGQGGAFAQASFPMPQIFTDEGFTVEMQDYIRERTPQEAEEALTLLGLPAGTVLHKVFAEGLSEPVVGWTVIPMENQTVTVKLQQNWVVDYATSTSSFPGGLNTVTVWQDGPINWTRAAVMNATSIVSSGNVTVFFVNEAGQGGGGFAAMSAPEVEPTVVPSLSGNTQNTSTSACPTTALNAAQLMGGTEAGWREEPNSNGTGWKYGGADNPAPSTLLTAPSFGRIDAPNGSFRNGQTTTANEATLWCNG